MPTAKAQGDRWENDVHQFLAAVHGSAVLKPAQHGFEDVGDRHLSPFVLQAKDVGSVRLPVFVDAAELQARRAGEPYGVAAIKRRGRSVAEGYAVMSLASFRDLVRWARQGMMAHDRAAEPKNRGQDNDPD